MLRSVLLPSLALLVLTPAAGLAKIKRDVDRSFPVSAGSEIQVDISGGSIEVEIVPGDTAALTLHQTFKTNDESEIADILEDYDITFEQRGKQIVLAVKRDRSGGGGWFSGWGGSNASFSVSVSCPTFVHLNLDTSGGSIRVDGLVEGDLVADTSGGSIKVTGGSGDLNLDTSGGSISVEQVLGKVRADTSGGSIRIDYVGPKASDVNADTSGGGIRIGLDPQGGYDINADTSGGSVSINDLSLTPRKMSRTHVEGKVNAGGARVRADTSGGSITIFAASR